MSYIVKDSSGAEIRNVYGVSQGKVLGDKVCDVPQGTEIKTIGFPFQCFTDASLSEKTDVIQVDNVKSGSGYVRLDVLKQTE